MKRYEQMFGMVITDRIINELNEISYEITNDYNNAKHKAEHMINQGVYYSCIDELRYYMIDSIVYADEDDWGTDDTIEKIYRLYSLAEKDINVFKLMVNEYYSGDNIVFGQEEVNNVMNDLLGGYGYNARLEDYSLKNLPK